MANTGAAACTRWTSATSRSVPRSAVRCTTLYTATKPTRKAAATPRITHVNTGLTVRARSSRMRSSSAVRCGWKPGRIGKKVTKKR